MKIDINEIIKITEIRQTIIKAIEKIDSVELFCETILEEKDNPFKTSQTRREGDLKKEADKRTQAFLDYYYYQNLVEALKKISPESFIKIIEKGIKE